MNAARYNEAADEQGYTMCKFKNLGVSWPPKGWEQFDGLDQSYAQALVKDPVSAMVRGLSYEVEPIPIARSNCEPAYLYHLKIEGWDYNIYNESREYAVLSMTLRDKPQSNAPQKASKHLYMSNIKSCAQSIEVTARSAQRSYMAALFIMKQIISGIVPDVDRILKLYKIHPLQMEVSQMKSETLKMQPIRMTYDGKREEA